MQESYLLLAFSFHLELFRIWFELRERHRSLKGVYIAQQIDVFRERLALILRFCLPMLIVLSGLVDYLVMKLLIVSIVLLRLIVTLRPLMLNELSSLLESHLVSVREVLVLIEALVREIVVLLALDEIT